MGLPAAYSDDALTQLIVTLPRAPNADSTPHTIAVDEENPTTERGVDYNYTKSKRGMPIWVFFVPNAMVSTFKTLYDAVVTDETRIAFYFLRDGDVLSPPTALHCKWIGDFDPEPTGRYRYNGTVQQWFIIRLRLKEEITAADIEE